jgi:hypothetical protein
MWLNEIQDIGIKSLHTHWIFNIVELEPMGDPFQISIEKIVKKLNGAEFKTTATVTPLKYNNFSRNGHKWNSIEI